MASMPLSLNSDAKTAPTVASFDRMAMLHPLTAKSVPLNDNATPPASLTRSRHW